MDFIKKTNKNYVDIVLDRLVRYPNVEISPKKSQSFSRNKQIRKLTKQKKIKISKGTVFIPENFQITKTKNGNYKIKIKY